MKILIWTLTALVALVWTGGTWIVAELTQWVSQAISSGVAVDVAVAATPWPVPAWLAPWVDPATVQIAQQGLTALLAALREGWPMLGGLIGWLVPLVWFAWGVGLALMLALAGGLHWLVGRTGPGKRPPSPPAVVAV